MVGVQPQYCCVKICSVSSEVGHYVTRSVGEVRQEEGEGKREGAKSASCGDDE